MYFLTPHIMAKTANQNQNLRLYLVMTDSNFGAKIPLTDCWDRGPSFSVPAGTVHLELDVYEANDEAQAIEMAKSELRMQNIPPENLSLLAVELVR